MILLIILFCMYLLLCELWQKCDNYHSWFPSHKNCVSDSYNNYNENSVFDNYYFWFLVMLSFNSEAIAHRWWALYYQNLIASLHCPFFVCFLPILLLRSSFIPSFYPSISCLHLYCTTCDLLLRFIYLIGFHLFIY